MTALHSRPTPADVQAVVEALQAKRVGSGKWTARCPAHADDSPSLSISVGTSQPYVVHCHAGCPQEDVLEAIRERLGRGPVLRVETGGRAREELGREVARYEYVTADGGAFVQARRYDPKKFRPFHVDPTASDGWRMGLGGRTPPLYRLPQVLEAVALERRVLFVEGEKDVHAAEDLGFVATTVFGGAERPWVPSYTDALTGADVVILPDNDDAGRTYAARVRRELDGHAHSVRIVTLPGLPPKGDLSDWVAAGGTRAQLEQLLADAETAPATPIVSEEDRALFSDDVLALGLSAELGGRLRITHAWGDRIYLHDGTRFVRDTKLTLFDRARAHLRRASEDTEKPQLKRELQSAAKVGAVVQMLRADQTHAVAPEEWDANPHEIATPDGLVDLRTGAIRRATTADLITKCTAVAPGGRCPRWLELLAWVTHDDAELLTFLQTVAGYCLTGSVIEHALFFLYGTGGNGKGTVLSALTGILADYHVTAAMETFLSSPVDRHPADLAMLRGARMVTAQETSDGRRWDEARLKTLTGGDPITARHMRSDFFTFDPQFKLVIASNHKPALTSVDHAIRRRFHLIPFLRQVSESQRNPLLGAQLRAEWPGILAWMIEGAVRWHEQGLRAPASVREATEAYLSSEDSLATWLAESCERDGSAWESVHTLFASWGRWCDTNGERPGSAKRFSENLRSHGFEAVRVGKGGTRGFAGLRLLDRQGGTHAHD